MEELNNFLHFILENSDDKRITISKKMKYGFQHFYINFNIDQLDKDGNYSGRPNAIFYRNSLSIIIDNRNKCIEIESEIDDKSLVIEDEEFVNRWSLTLDEFLSIEITKKISDIIDITLSSCENKNLHRDYKMKKIFKDDELI
jgi:hypothetical protein